ncbi:MAG: hypothetical protein Q9179_005402 [Wetmoreana sp. 5 TL-2023]
MANCRKRVRGDIGSDDDPTFQAAEQGNLTEVERLREENERKGEQIERLEKENAGLKNEVAGLKNEVTGLKSEVTHFSGEIDDMVNILTEPPMNQPQGEPEDNQSMKPDFLLCLPDCEP